MFKSPYQSGLLSVLYNMGSNPLQILDSVQTKHRKCIADPDCQLNDSTSIGIKLQPLFSIVTSLKKLLSCEGRRRISCEVRASPATVSQADFIDCIRARHPDYLTRNFYRLPDSFPQAYFKMSLSQKVDCFCKCLDDLSLDDATDAGVARLFSFGYQPIWRHHDDKEQSTLHAVESLLVAHLGTWGVGPVLPVLREVLESRLEAYVKFKVLEIRAAAKTCREHGYIPCVTVNLRPADLLLPEVVQGFIDAAIALGEPGRLAAELTEYMDDEVWAQRTAGIDNIDDKVHVFVIPKLRELRSHGILIVADDLKPQSVYAKEDLFSTYATELDRMLRYDDLFDVWKFDLEWCMHAFRINKDTDPETYGRLPLYAREVMTSPEHIAACCDHPGPHSCRLAALQDAAERCMQRFLRDAAPEKTVIIEQTLNCGAGRDMVPGGISGNSNIYEQGGLYFESKAPPEYFVPVT